MSSLCHINEVPKHINLNEYFCEGCGAYLKEEDWPFLYRAVGRLCNSCKSKADILLKQGTRKCLMI